MRETLRKHGIEAQPASEFNAREEGCWLLTDEQFAGMECRVVVRVGGVVRVGNAVRLGDVVRLGDDNYSDANATCRCTSYLIHVADTDSLGRFKPSTGFQCINPYPAGTHQHREVQNRIDGKFNVYIGSRLLGHIVLCVQEVVTHFI